METGTGQLRPGINQSQPSQGQDSTGPVMSRFGPVGISKSHGQATPGQVTARRSKNELVELTKLGLT